MSYIRSGSNPEGLYIFGSDGAVTICHGVKPPLASKTTQFNVPLAQFEGVCARWYAGAERVRVRDTIVEEVHLNRKTGKPPQDPPMTFPWSIFDSDNTFLIRFQHKKHFFCMWSVTWDAVVRSYYYESKRKARA